MNHIYHIIAEVENTRITVETNEIDIAVDSLMQYAEQGIEVMVIDGITGEILVRQNSDENWIVEEWSLIILGWLCQNTWG